MNRTAYAWMKGDDPILVHTFTTADLSPQDWKHFTEHYIDAVKAMTIEGGPKLEFTVLEQQDGKDVILQRISPPIALVSARSVIVKQFTFEDESGLTFFLTSRDSDAENVKYKDRIGKDVIGTLEINYWHFKPHENGLGAHVTHINNTKPNGSIPNFAISKMIKKGAEAGIQIANYIRKQKQ